MNIAMITFRFPSYPMIGRMTNVVELKCSFLTDKTDIKDIQWQVLFDRYFHGISGAEAMQNADYCEIGLSNGQRWVVKDRTGAATPYLMES